jgi:MFS family permease
MRLPPARLAFLMWGMAATFYLFGFFQRVAPASLAGDLMRDFGLTAAALGNLSAFYYYAYAGMQLPTGVLVDRYGPSRLFFVGALLAGAGALLFALSPTMAGAALGRALIGAAHGFAWVSMLKLVAHWFPTTRFASMSGLSLAVGTLGAVLAGPPLRWLADDYGWRMVIGASGGLALLLAGLIKWKMRDDPLDRRYRSYAPPSAHRQLNAAQSWGSVLRGVVEVWRYRNTALLFLVNGGVCGAFLTFTGLWGVPYLAQVHGLSVKQAALVTAAMLVLFSIGGIVFGTWSDRWQRRKTPFLIGATLTAVGFAALALAPQAPLTLLVPVLVLAGFGAGSMAISFGLAKESVPAGLQGTVTGAINMGVMTGTLIQMPLLGVLLDARWDGALAKGVRQYSADAYQAGWWVLFAWVLAAVALLSLTRETHARQNGGA